MKHKKILIFTIAVIVLGVLWALFRPDLLFVNKKTEDPFPDAPEVTTPGPSNAEAPSADAAKKPSAEPSSSDAAKAPSAVNGDKR